MRHRPSSRIAAPSRLDPIPPRARRRPAQTAGGGGRISQRGASLGVVVAAGSRHESEGEHGLSHLLEHMAFKGTAKRNARAIAETIENVVRDLNAETSVEQTAYFDRVLGEDVDLALDVIADILTDSRFDPEELARENNVSLQE